MLMNESLSHTYSIIGIVLGCLHMIAPMDVVNQFFFRIKESEPSKLEFQHAKENVFETVIII
jgi:hypothetical protein